MTETHRNIFRAALTSGDSHSLCAQYVAWQN